MNGLTDLAMPYMIQTLRDYAGKVDALMAARKEAQVGPNTHPRRLLYRNIGA